MTSNFGSVAWISMVLVDERMRNRGIGKALLIHALEYLDRGRVPSIRLDATPLGRPLYEQLGFTAQYLVTRYEGALPTTFEAVECPNAPAQAWGILAGLDQYVTAAARSALLWCLFTEGPSRIRYIPWYTGLLPHHAMRGLVFEGRNGTSGFMTARPGYRAVQLGPCIAGPTAGPLLFADAWRRYGGQRVFLDIPDANEPASQWARAHGLTAQRHWTRMCRGTPSVERVDWLWASSGPEKG